MLRKKTTILLLSVFVCLRISAQPTDSDIWLFQLKKTEKGIELKNGFNMTNNPGYDNQPFFSQDGKFLLFTSIREGNQSDIYKYSFKSKKISKLTSTKTSEYSPMLMPDGSKISVVMVEQDSTQRIWSFPSLEKKDKSPIVSEEQKPFLEEIDSVGYYCYLNMDTIVYYKLTQPHSLRVFCISTKKDFLLGYEPTRSFKPCGTRQFFYVLKSEDNNELRIYDWAIRKSEVVAYSDKSNEDFIFNKDLGFMKSEADKIFCLNMVSKNWMEWKGFSSFGINKITRFAISPDGKWLAVVSNK
jgi:Tol biopolymer transport system component